MTKNKVVFTSMVADLFHYGHLELLRRCRDLGNYLVVGIIKDEEVFRYKNRLPIIPFKERFEIVSNIKYVDLVLAQDTRDGSNNLKKLGKVDYLVRGNDAYLTKEVATVKRLGGEFVQLKRTDGISTSDIIKRVKSL